jgi:hypothetical protein
VSVDRRAEGEEVCADCMEWNEDEVLLLLDGVVAIVEGVGVGSDGSVCSVMVTTEKERNGGLVEEDRLLLATICFLFRRSMCSL